MANERTRLRGAVLVEDRRTERFFRKLLDALGFDIRRFKFRPAPSGGGDAKRWVRAQYREEVQLLRRKNYQRLVLVAVRDGDNVGFAASKADLDDALEEAGMPRRRVDERICTPAPTWCIETWLLLLLGDNDVDETESLKTRFEARYLKDEGTALRDAARAWAAAQGHPAMPSFADGKQEMTRLDL